MCDRRCAWHNSYTYAGRTVLHKKALRTPLHHYYIWCYDGSAGGSRACHMLLAIPAQTPQGSPEDLTQRLLTWSKPFALCCFSFLLCWTKPALTSLLLAHQRNSSPFERPPVKVTETSLESLDAWFPRDANGWLPCSYRSPALIALLVLSTVMDTDTKRSFRWKGGNTGVTWSASSSYRPRCAAYSSCTFTGDAHTTGLTFLH